MNDSNKAEKYQQAIDKTKELIELEHKKIDLLKQMVIALELKKIKHMNPGRDRVYHLSYTRKGTTYSLWFVNQDDLWNYEKKHRLRMVKTERKTYKLPDSA